MSEGDGNQPPALDTSAAEGVINQEKVTALETELAQYKQADADRIAADKAEEKKSIEERLSKVETEKLEMAKSFDEKLEKIKMRSSTQTPPNKETLSEEDYNANKEAYDTMYLKTILPNVFDQQ